MPSQTLDIAFWNYDRRPLLADTSVKIDGVDARFHSARILPEISASASLRRMVTMPA